MLIGPWLRALPRLEPQPRYEYLFSTWGVLAADTAIAGLVTVFAVLVLWTAVAAGAWILWRMYRVNV